MKTQVVKLHLIPKNPKFQVRKHGTDTFHITRMQLVYERHKADGTKCPIPPPRLFKIGNVYYPTRGFHRIEAMIAAGIEQAEFEVVVGATISDAAVDASEGNLDNTGLSMKPEDVKRAVVMRYDHAIGDKILTDKALAEKYGVHRTTIAKWLNEHDPRRAEQTERVDADGVKHKLNARKGDKKKSEPKDEPKEPEVDLFAEDTVSATDTGGEESAAPPSPEIDTPARKDGEYPPDERFMPNAEDAANITAVFTSIVARMKQVKSDMAKLLPNPQHPIANRLHLHTTFLPNLGVMIDDIINNTPSHVCPDCAGTTTKLDGLECLSCSGYGMVAAGDADAMKQSWKAESGDRYNRLAKEADIAEAVA